MLLHFMMLSYSLVKAAKAITIQIYSAKIQAANSLRYSCIDANRFIFDIFHLMLRSLFQFNCYTAESK